MDFDVIFDALGEIWDAAGSLIGEIFGSELSAEVLGAVAESVGLVSVSIGAAALAAGAIVAFKEIDLDGLKRFLSSKKLANKITDILNNDPATLERMMEGRLQDAPKCSISDMINRVQEIRHTKDNQDIITIRSMHPKSMVYTDIVVAANKSRGLYVGQEIHV